MWGDVPACENCGKNQLRRWRCGVCGGLVCQDCISRSSGDEYGWCVRYPWWDVKHQTPDYCKQRWVLIGKPRAWFLLTPQQQKEARKAFSPS